MDLAQFINNFKTAPFAVLMAAKDFVLELQKELTLLDIKILHAKEDFFLVEQTSFKNAKRNPIWMADHWLDCHILEIISIKKVQGELKKVAPKWVHASFNAHRRGELILEGLPTLKKKRLIFNHAIKPASYGVFGLLDEKNLFYCAKAHALVPFCFHEFEEDKTTPPSRAYLKLWEVFSVHEADFANRLKGMKVVDMGACPGGWSWVLQQLGAQVHSYDKATLDPKIAKLPGITFHQESAFGVIPNKEDQIDAFFSDIICYPSKLLELVMRWRNAGVRNFVCTLKFQKETDYDSVEKFLQMSGSKIIHLHHNKHEVTWISLDNGENN